MIVHHDFGRSLNYDEFSVNDILFASLPISVALGLVAITIATIGGVAVGTVAAVGRWG